MAIIHDFPIIAQELVNRGASTTVQDIYERIPLEYVDSNKSSASQLELLVNPDLKERIDLGINPTELQQLNDIPNILEPTSQMPHAILDVSSFEGITEVCLSTTKNFVEYICDAFE